MAGERLTSVGEQMLCHPCEVKCMNVFKLTIYAIFKFVIESVNLKIIAVIIMETLARLSYHPLSVLLWFIPLHTLMFLFSFYLLFVSPLANLFEPLLPSG